MQDAGLGNVCAADFSLGPHSVTVLLLYSYD
jgi:hypothetical protein